MTRVTLVAVLVLTFAAHAAPAQAQVGARGFYEDVESVYLRASVEIVIRHPLYDGHTAPVQGVGFVEHWGQGDRFRTVVWVDPVLGLGGSMDVAFDGAFYQVHLLDMDSLSRFQQPFQFGESLQVPTPIRNPFYLPVTYLAASDDDCPACPLTLPLVKSEEIWSRVSLSGAESVVDVLGGSLDGEGYNYRVYHQTTEIESGSGTMGRLERIERVGVDALIRQSLAFSQFQDGFPHVIRLSGYDPEESSEVVVTVNYEIEELVLNDRLDNTVFTIAPNETTRVFEDGELIQEAKSTPMESHEPSNDPPK